MNCNEKNNTKTKEQCLSYHSFIRENTKKVGATGVIVYYFLTTLSDENNICVPCQKTLSRILGYSRSTIGRTLKALEKHGLIKVKKRSRYNCIYELSRGSNAQMSQNRTSDASKVHTIDNKYLYIDIDTCGRNDTSGFKPKNREELLALELAIALNDLKGLPLYLSYSSKYPETVLRRILGEVKEIPDSKIKKSRGALFNHLVKKYVMETH